MQFYDATNKQGICQRIDFLCNSNDTSYPRVEKTVVVNSSYEQVVGWILNADGTWQFDDTNYTDFPIGTYTMVADQAKYSFNDKFLQLMHVQIKDSGGNFQIIRPIDQSEYSDYTPLEEDYETSGMPQYYDKLADDTIKLLPAPSAAATTLVSGLKIYFKRTASTFTVATDTSADTKQPGFASPFHMILAYMAARPYAAQYKKELVPWLNTMIGDLTPEPTGMKRDIIKHYATRGKDQRKLMTMQQTSYF